MKYSLFTVFVGVVLFAFTNQATADGFLRPCYYTYQDDLPPSGIEPNLCTHIILGFSSMQNATMVPQNDSDIQVYRELLKLKSLYTVQIMISGGSLGMSDMVSSPVTRTRFILSAVDFLRKYEFDGMDFDWEFPAWGGNPASDKENFAAFLLEMRSTFEKEAVATKRPRLLLSVATSASLTIIEKAYDIVNMSIAVDWVNLMTYDFHFFVYWDPATAHNSPLYPRKNEIGIFDTMNTEWAVDYWIKKGLDRSKMMVGIPTYGHTYTLLTEYLHSVNAPAVGNGVHGGDISLGEVCTEFLQKGATSVVDEQSQVPYLYMGRDWISYEDLQSADIKSRWVKKNQFGGAFLFSVNADDYKGVCNGTKFPIHRVVQSILG